MNRRQAIFGTIALAAGCSGPLTPSQIATDVALINAGIDVLVPILMAADAKDGTAIGKAAADAKAALVALSGAVGDKPTASDMLIAALDALGSLATTYLPAGSPYAGTIPAAIVLAKLIIAQVGVQPKATAARGPTMSADQARAVLRR